MHSLDFSTLPKVDFGHAFMAIDDGVLAGIAPLKMVTERASNALRFACLIGGTSELLRCPEAEVKQLREGYFRAALTEFASIEEVQLLDYTALSMSRSPLKLNGTSSPLLHLFRELRNLEVHLRHSELRKMKKGVLWGEKDRLADANPVTISIWLLEGVTSQSFGSLKNARHYSTTQIDQMINWFNATQEEWGIQEMFLLAVEEYCRRLRV